MKIIIAGIGKMGYTLAEQLSSENHDITLIDKDETVLNRAAGALDVLCIRGNGASLGALREAGADAADILISVTSRDEVNMVSCAAAKRLGAGYTIARIREADYAADFPYLKETLGIDMAINPEYSTAVEISRLLRFPSAEDIDTFYRGQVELVSFHAQEGDFINGKPLSALARHLKQLSILFCGVERGKDFFIPNGTATLQPGDKIYLIGDIPGVSSFFRKLGRLVRPPHSAFIVGGGRIAGYLTAALADMNMRVTLVEREEAVCRRLSETFENALVIHGDGTDQSLLESENLTAAGAFLALTGQDEANLVTALYAAQVGVPKVIAKINRQNYDGVARAVGVESIVSPKLIAAGHILRTVRGMHNTRSGVMQALYIIAGGRAEAIEFIAGASTRRLGVPLRSLRLKKGVLIAILARHGVVKIPDGDSCIKEGDNVVIISTVGTLLELNDIFEEGEEIGADLPIRHMPL